MYFSYHFYFSTTLAPTFPTTLHLLEDLLQIAVKVPTGSNWAGQTQVRHQRHPAGGGETGQAPQVVGGVGLVQGGGGD